MRKSFLRADWRMLVYAGVVVGSLLAGIVVVVPIGSAQSLGDGPCSACVCHTSR